MVKRIVLGKGVLILELEEGPTKKIKLKNIKSITLNYGGVMEKIWISLVSGVCLGFLINRNTEIDLSGLEITSGRSEDTLLKEVAVKDKKITLTLARPNGEIRLGADRILYIMTIKILDANVIVEVTGQKKNGGYLETHKFEIKDPSLLKKLIALIPRLDKISNI